MNKPIVLITEEQESSLSNIKDALVRLGYEVTDSPAPAIHVTERSHCNVSLIVLESSQKRVNDIRQIRSRNKSIPIIMLGTGVREEVPIEAFRAGVNDYFPHPVSFSEVEDRLKVLCSTHMDSRGQGSNAEQNAEMQFIGQSAQMLKIKNYICKVALTDSTVLITGETGTGKEMAAEMIYQHSRRCDKPFICVNCAAIPDSLLESELFGHERGAFTGASGLQKGKFELAQGGTIFLDEIGDMCPSAQAKILRVLENKQLQRLGGTRPMALDVRVVAATNQLVELLASEGKFRRDLYYRLNVARVHLPPLRERKEDIQDLLLYYIDMLSRQFGRRVDGMTEEVLECLLRYQWPGNVRELKNILEGMFVDLSSSRITMRELPEYIRGGINDNKNARSGERERLLLALFTTKWNKTRAAEQLNWSRMTLYRKMAKYSIGAPGCPSAVEVDARASGGARCDSRV
jgi:DNA-binding NtrC family response regulator